jgi:DNA replication protein DnaD
MTVWHEHGKTSINKARDKTRKRSAFSLGDIIMPITQQQLLQILPSAGKPAGVFASALNLALDRFQINTWLRMDRLRWNWLCVTKEAS